MGLGTHRPLEWEWEKFPHFPFILGERPLFTLTYFQTYATHVQSQLLPRNGGNLRIQQFFNWTFDWSLHLKCTQCNVCNFFLHIQFRRNWTQLQIILVMVSLSWSWVKEKYGKRDIWFTFYFWTRVGSSINLNVCCMNKFGWNGRCVMLCCLNKHKILKYYNV